MTLQTNSEADLREVVDQYLDGLYNGDTGVFEQVFHPQASLFSATEGKLVALSRDQYFAIVAARPSSASRCDRREDEVLSLTVSSPTTAHARVRDLYLPKHFVDELTFVFIDGRWQVVSKVWHFELE